jgi:hypothetical protein
VSIGYTFCRNCLLKHVTGSKYKEGQKRREYEEEDASRYSMILRKTEGIENWNRKY